MKIWICFFALATALAAADKKPASKAESKPVAREITLPAGAIETSPGTYSYSDNQGRKWIYRKTPFGLTRLEDKPAATAPKEPAPKQDEAMIKAVEDGDAVHFERPGPFGAYRWTKKKSELNETERQALAKQGAKEKQE